MSIGALTHDPALLSLADATARLRTRSILPRDLLKANLARIDRLDGRLNAVLWLDRSGAMAAADAMATDRRPDVVAGRLHGLPLAHKDLFATAGLPQTAGSAWWQGRVAAHTSTVLARLQAAGSITFAGLNMAEFAQNPTGHNATVGDCINPWQPDAIAGGSSSGSAVAVAVGYCAGSLGSDTGGSIRLPAACCGVTGLKPTWGLVSRAGVVPLAQTLDAVGPIARTARDCAILLALIAGADPADPTCAALPVPAYEAALDDARGGGNLAGQRIGVPDAWFFDDAAPEVLAACTDALAALADRGATLVPIGIPLLPAITTYGGTMARVEAAALHAQWMREDPQRYVPHVSGRLYPGYAIPATYYVEAMTRRPQILAEFVATVFDRVDAIATPTLRSRAPTRTQTDVDRGPAGTEQRFFAVGGNVRPFNYLGLPALTMPVGIDANGVPIGLQLVGRPYGEARLLRIADAWQRTAGPPPIPPMAR